MTDINHTPLPWKAVSAPHFDSGLVYTSVQPINVDEDGMKALKMMNGEHHICRMSHTAAPWRYRHHQADAAFIVEACNAYYENRAALAAKDSEIAALKSKIDPLVGLLTSLVAESGREVGWGEEDSFRMGEWFEAHDLAAIEAARAALKEKADAE